MRGALWLVCGVWRVVAGAGVLQQGKVGVACAAAQPELLLPHDQIELCARPMAKLTSLARSHEVGLNLSSQATHPRAAQEPASRCMKERVSPVTSMSSMNSSTKPCLSIGQMV